ncbi:hypothetical protein PV341_02860 [Streptomyces sp. PA03-1a]|nr:hypothetical protein [Streptomyces sp. PA03-1a]MDX2812856.1 hypothetical protein [Streptomyces sp. PA03-5A]
MDLDTVFAELDRVAWAELHHAYGPAGDVPALLRALTSPEQETAEEAEQELWGGAALSASVYGSFTADAEGAGLWVLRPLGLAPDGVLAPSPCFPSLVHPASSSAPAAASSTGLRKPTPTHPFALFAPS